MDGRNTLCFLGVGSRIADVNFADNIRNWAESVDRKVSLRKAIASKSALLLISFPYVIAGNTYYSNPAIL